MGRGNSSDSRTLTRVRADVAASLRERAAELEQNALTRVRAISGGSAPTDAEYTAGLGSAVAAALECGLGVLEGSSPQTAPIPPPLLVQARLAARCGVGLEVVLRRYTAGHALLNDAIAETLAANDRPDARVLRLLLREQSALLDRAIAAVTDEYRLEAVSRDQPRSRQVQVVERLLAGDPLDPVDLAYGMDAWHVGVVAFGPGVEPALKALASELGRRLLLVEADPDCAWAWLGGIRRLDSSAIARAAASSWPDRAFLAIGEPGHRLAGWRFTHRQARVLTPLVRGGSTAVVRYADNALLASIAQDDLLVQSLRQLYVTPLEQERDAGRELRRTLRAYFAARGNVSSTAKALKVERKTVSTRIERVEERIGRTLASCSCEIEAALALDGLSEEK